MARTTERLNPRQAANAKPPKDKNAALFADGGNLYLQVSRGNDGHIRRSWLFRYEINDGQRYGQARQHNRRREMGLGPLHTVGLAEARAAAKALRQQLLDGIDPLEQKREQRQAKLAEAARKVTFQRCAEMYLTLHRPGWKHPKHVQQWQNTLTAYVYPLIGGLPVADVDSAMVLKIVEPMWSSKTETASRVRGRIEVILDYATANGFRAGDNPARHVVASLPKKGKVQKVEHHAALPWQAIPLFMGELRERDSVSAHCLEFTVLTCARTAEAIGATWDEIDEKAKTWTIPAARMKAERDHRVPLTDRALEILRGLPRHGQHIFSASRSGAPLSNMAMLSLLRTLRPNTTVHGFRSAFRDWAAERTNYPNHVVEMALAHAVGNKVEAAYRRGDLFEKRRRLMGEWAKYCASPPRKKDDADDAVINLVERAAHA